jgi:NAD(P)H-dependent FMN reductase
MTSVMLDGDAMRIALIVGSTRPNRFADHPVKWIQQGAANRTDVELEALDLRDWPLPFFDEATAPVSTGGTFSHPLAQRWGEKIAAFDGFIICTAEYYHGPPAVLLNALHYAMNEWKHKPVSYVGYGGLGAARAIEHLRLTAIQLRMAPLSLAVHIGFEAFLGVQSEGKLLDDYPYLLEARTLMFNQLVWWARTLAPARAAHERAAEALGATVRPASNTIV